MKKILIVVALLVTGLSFYPVLGQSQMGYGHHGGGDGWYCPYCGSHMGGGYHGSQYQKPQKPIDEKEAASIAGRYVQRNPNLKVGAVKDTGSAFEVEIRTKDNSLVDKVLVDKNSGWIKSAY